MADDPEDTSELKSAQLTREYWSLSNCTPFDPMPVSVAVSVEQIGIAGGGIAAETRKPRSYRYPASEVCQRDPVLEWKPVHVQRKAIRRPDERLEAPENPRVVSVAAEILIFYHDIIRVHCHHPKLRIGYVVDQASAPPHSSTP
jgi:hypothetical protein